MTDHAPHPSIELDAPEGVVTHYLVNVVGVGDRPQFEDLAMALGRALQEVGITHTLATAYMTDLPINPRDVGIRETWAVMSSQDKDTIRATWPQLSAAIDLICGVTIRGGK